VVTTQQGVRMLAVLGLGTLYAPPAMALPWDIAKDRSSLSFTATQNNVPVTGSFKSFEGDIEFDPGHLETSHVKISIDMGSVSSSHDGMAATLKTPAWFSAQLFPKAFFEGSGFTHITGQRYDVKGMLTIRDKTVPVVLGFDLAEYQPDHAKAVGKATLSRTALGVGQGEWQDTKMVKDEVTVSFVIEATPREVK
jgi:polyisoprenoid-binding protein YceI